MLSQILVWRQCRIRTIGKTLLVLIIATLSALLVWIRTFSVLTVVQEVKYGYQMNVSSRGNNRTLQTPSPKFSQICKSSTGASNYHPTFTAVILLTYMRSGSSFTGDILQQNENVFYVFEPLRMLNHLIKSKKPVQWMNGTMSAISSLNITEVKRHTMIGWLTCNFSMVYAQSFEDWYFFSFGKKTVNYNKCVTEKNGISLEDPSQNSSSNKTGMHIRVPAFRRGVNEKCLQDLQNACLSSKVRIVKTIRTSMDLADQILNDINESKIIHLIRDPRETVVSQARYHGCPDGKVSVVACANWHCRNVWDDSISKSEIMAEKPGRILTVLYENLLYYPSPMTKIMYKFVGMAFTKKISDYVINVSQGQNVTGCTVCQQTWQARNVSRTSNNRVNKLSKMNPYVLSYLQHICEYVIKQYGYKFYNTSRSLYRLQNIS